MRRSRSVSAGSEGEPVARRTRGALRGGVPPVPQNLRPLQPLAARTAPVGRVHIFQPAVAASPVKRCDSPPRSVAIRGFYHGQCYQNGSELQALIKREKHDV